MARAKNGGQRLALEMMFDDVIGACLLHASPSADLRAGLVGRQVSPTIRTLRDQSFRPTILRIDYWRDSSVPRRTSFEYDDRYDDEPSGKRRSGSSWQRDDEDMQRRKPAHHDMRKVVEGRESFKCGHCRAFVGPTISGGKHRNHCPLCLYSRHVDLGHPGDRRCECRSLMEPIGLCSRRGEELLVHRCLGCGAERVCRVAADDSPVPLGELPFVPYPGREAEQVDLDPFDPGLEVPG